LQSEIGGIIQFQVKDFISILKLYLCKPLWLYLEEHNMKDGYYWVRVDATTEWEIAYLKNETWYFNGDGFSHSHEYVLENVAEIGDYIETPDKYKRGLIK